MIIDTDVLIWFLRGSAKAARMIDAGGNHAVSCMSYMELQQGARNKAETRAIRSLFPDLGIAILPLTENIGHRAMIYVEEYAVSSSLQMADALIAATAIEHGATLLSGNAKRFRAIQELDLKPYRP